MSSGTYKLLFEVPKDKEFPISNTDNSSIKKKKKKTSWAKMCSVCWNSDCDWGESAAIQHLNNAEGFFLWTWFLTPIFRSLASLINVLYIYICKFCLHFVMCIPKYFKNFDATVSGTYFLFFFLVYNCSLSIERWNWFMHIDLLSHGYA